MDEECVYCYNLVTDTEAPDATDEAMWAIIAEEHDPECEWIATRAHRIANVMRSESQ